MKLGIILSLSTLADVFSATNAFAQSPASVSWPLTNPSAGGTGRLANVSGNVFADSEYFKNKEIK